MRIPETILSLAAKRGRTKTICPSEVARHLWPDNWRSHMEEVRTAAFQLQDEGQLRILQKGVEVAGKTATGPIRLSGI